MINSITAPMTPAALQPRDTASDPTSSSGSLDGMATEQTFLQLLVAQLQNQDPLQPQDGTQFVAQLAQFSSLEQEIQMRTDLDSINQSLNPPATQSGTQGSTNS